MEGISQPFYCNILGRRRPKTARQHPALGSFRPCPTVTEESIHWKDSPGNQPYENIFQSPNTIDTSLRSQQLNARIKALMSEQGDFQYINNHLSSTHRECSTKLLKDFYQLLEYLVGESNRLAMDDHTFKQNAKLLDDAYERLGDSSKAYNKLAPDSLKARIYQRHPRAVQKGCLASINEGSRSGVQQAQVVPQSDPRKRYEQHSPESNRSSKRRKIEINLNSQNIKTTSSFPNVDAELEDWSEDPQFSPSAEVQKEWLALTKEKSRSNIQQIQVVLRSGPPRRYEEYSVELNRSSKKGKIDLNSQNIKIPPLFLDIDAESEDWPEDPQVSSNAEVQNHATQSLGQPTIPIFSPSYSSYT